MTRLLPLFLLAAGVVFTAVPIKAQNAAGKVVYVYPMSGGLDQHLANWLTREHAMQVTTDPKLADFVLTDKLGETLNMRLVELHPTPEEEAADAQKPIYRAGAPRGTLFLVDAKTRGVVWSEYGKPTYGNSGKLSMEAKRLVKSLLASFGKK